MVRSLERLDVFLNTADWKGRENELVSLFAHHCLPQEVHAGGPLRSLTQVGIEVAVLQVTGSSKRYVRKDLVIWPEPLMTAWSERPPSVIVEWKRNRPVECRKDVEWLLKFTKRYPETLGYSVCGLLNSERGVRFWVVSNGEWHQGSFPSQPARP